MFFFSNSTHLTNSSNATEGNNKTLSHQFCIALASYFLGLSVTGLTCNGILIYTIFTNKKLHKTGNYLVVNLAICDVITCFNLAFDSHFLLRHENYANGQFLCAFTKVINLALLPMSIMSLLLLTLEKLLTFLYPFQHRDVLTTRRAFLLLLISWLYSIAVGCFPVMSDESVVLTENNACSLQLTLDYKLYQLIVNFAVPLTCILMMNIYIFRIAMKSAATAKRLSNGTQNQQVELANKWRRTRIIFTVVANESLCWFSYMIAVAASIACRECLPQQVPWIMNAINYTSVTTNPLIYGLLNRSVRQFIRNLCCKRKIKKFVVRYSSGTIKIDQLSVSSKYSRTSRRSERPSFHRNDSRESARYLFHRKICMDTLEPERKSMNLAALEMK